jgi:hypothetical protein
MSSSPHLVALDDPKAAPDQVLGGELFAEAAEAMTEVAAHDNLTQRLRRGLRRIGTRRDPRVP